MRHAAASAGVRVRAMHMHVSSLGVERPREAVERLPEIVRPQHGEGPPPFCTAADLAAELRLIDAEGSATIVAGSRTSRKPTRWGVVPQGFQSPRATK